MSVSYRILNSELKLDVVVRTLRAIGVDIEYVDKGDGYDFYVIGNDNYGYIRMYVDKGIVTEFHQYGCGASPISMLFHCFNFIAYGPDDYDDGEIDNDLEELPAAEFFKKHYPHEYKVRERLQSIENCMENEHPDLFSYIKSISRTLTSYRYEYAYCKQLPISEVSQDDVISFIYEQAIACNAISNGCNYEQE